MTGENDPDLSGRRHPRLAIDVPVHTVGPDGAQDGRVQDISAGGAAVIVNRPMFSNDQFVTLHMEGYERLNGRIVRQFAGGYALQFAEDDESRQKLAAEIGKFRKLTGPSAALEG